MFAYSHSLKLTLQNVFFSFLSTSDICFVFSLFLSNGLITCFLLYWSFQRANSWFYLLDPFRNLSCKLLLSTYIFYFLPAPFSFVCVLGFACHMLYLFLLSISPNKCIYKYRFSLHYFCYRSQVLTYTYQRHLFLNSLKFQNEFHFILSITGQALSICRNGW